jgi:hypothetical protein
VLQARGLTLRRLRAEAPHVLDKEGDMSKARRARRWIGAGLVGLVFAGCAAQAASTGAPSPAYPSYGFGAPEEPSPARTVFNVIGTPFFAAFKVAVCAMTIGIGAPELGFAALTDPEGVGWQRQDLADGFAANCGGPWVLR